MRIHSEVYIMAVSYGPLSVVMLLNMQGVLCPVLPCILVIGQGGADFIAAVVFSLITCYLPCLVHLIGKPIVYAAYENEYLRHYVI